MSTPRLNVAILAGGRSSEHDISRLSATSVIEALDPERYEAVPVLIERSGDWRLTTAEKLALPAARPQDRFEDEDSDSARARRAAEADGTGSGTGTGMRLRAEVRPATVTNPSKALAGVDVIFPVLHGPFGEDGTMQGLLETAGVPYVGNGVLASAVGMDKAIFKAVLRDAGIDVAPEVVVHARRDGIDASIERAMAELSFPMFVKPARLGSSIGIGRATDEASLREALADAFEHDDKVLVEETVEGVEVECGVLGSDDPIASVPGEVQIGDDADWYDFETKYLEGRMELHVPARIGDEMVDKVRETSLAVFRAIECEGLARVDSFVTPDGRVVVNEVNTMPGFTATSAYAKLFEASGHSYSDVVDRLIQLALERHRTRQQLRH